MTDFAQFAARCKMRHDFSDQIQVRYTDENGEYYDTWISGDEVLQRLKTSSREKLIRSYARLNLAEARRQTGREIEQGKEKIRRHLQDRLADAVEDNLAGNIFGDTLVDKIRGVEGEVAPRQRAKAAWQQRLRDQAFRLVAMQIAWRNLEGSLPESEATAPDDWV